MTFYFTCHRQDLTRTRLPHGCRVMLVASSLWQERPKRFRRVQLPVDHLSGWCLDSGGFTAAKRWGTYPWTPAQYADWAREMAVQLPLDFCATMDYADLFLWGFLPGLQGFLAHALAPQPRQRFGFPRAVSIQRFPQFRHLRRSPFMASKCSMFLLTYASHLAIIMATYRGHNLVTNTWNSS
jgi:hypothetical protein